MQPHPGSFSPAPWVGCHRLVGFGRPTAYPVAAQEMPVLEPAQELAYVFADNANPVPAAEGSTSQVPAPATTVQAGAKSDALPAAVHHQELARSRFLPFLLLHLAHHMPATIVRCYNLSYSQTCSVLNYVTISFILFYIMISFPI